MLRKNNSGFTLVEVIVVAAIIAILAGILVPMIFSQIDEAKISRATADVRSISTAIYAFRKDVGTWPQNSADAGCSSTLLTSDGAVFSAALTASMTTQGYDSSDVKTLSSQLMYDPECYNNWNGPYLASVASDPWGNPYIMNTINISNKDFSTMIISAGPDGVIDTQRTAMSVHANDIGVRLK